ncbi:hypothetical protein [Streptomyces sp. NPDC059009]|uniref:hypothetical protein n=1 Tax=Streptomyces sp. NPDC059009 TaxID=3346694 RepID=UPI00369C6E18
MITTNEGAAVRFTHRGTARAARGLGIGVLALSLALTGCASKKNKKSKKRKSSSSHSRTIGGATGGSAANHRKKGGGSLAGAQSAQAVLPPATAMPAALRTVTTEPHSRAKAPTLCKDPGSKCKNAVAYGGAGYSTNDKAQGASYDVIVYRDARAARRAFAAWDAYVKNDERELRELLDSGYGADSVTFTYRTLAQKGTQETVILQDKYIGTLQHRDKASATSGVRPVLADLSEVYAQRLRQAADGETPTASAATVKVS